MIVEALRRFVELHRIEPAGIVVACSGGADSTALLLAFSELRSDGFRVTCAHVNHHLRGEESDADEQFVRSLCEQLRVPLVVLQGRLDESAVRRGGIEAAAREVRHRLLQSARSVCDAHFIATAHQLNDQAETVVLRILTGSSLGGLRAIHPLREDGIIRPLLDVPRSEIEAFLASRSIVPRRDSMNDDRRFLRSRVRAALRDLDDATVARIASVASDAQAVWPELDRMIGDAGEIEVTEDETRFVEWPEDPWLQRALLLRHIRRLDPSSRDVSSRDLERLTTTRSAIRRVSVTQSLELLRRGEVLVLRRRPDATVAPEFELELSPDETAFIPEIDAAIRLVPSPAGTIPLANAGRSAQRFQLPPNAQPRFVVRNRRPGDRFQPLGMQQDKKLKDFLIDRRIDAARRDTIPLLLWNDQIVWVAGVEVSERFKVSPSHGARFEVTLDHGFQEREAVDQR